MQGQEDDVKDKAAEAMKCFMGQFGTADIYTQIVLEEFFKELIGNDTK